MIKYVTGNVEWGVEAKITPTEVERETETSVWVNGIRRAKVTGWDVFHNTWAEAHNHLLKHAERHAELARRNLEVANSRLGNVKGMKQP